MNNLKLKIGINATCFDERSSGAKNRFIGLYSKVFQKLNNCELNKKYGDWVNPSDLLKKLAMQEKGFKDFESLI